MAKSEEVGDDQVVMELPLSMAEVLMGMTDAIERISRDAGLMLINAVMESECERIAGVKHSKNPGRQANWWGQDDGHVYFDGRTIPILKPRLRGRDKREIPLKTYKMLQNPDGIKETVHRKIILGLTSRNYEEASESFLKGYGIKKSSISRSFVKATAGQLKEFLERDLSNLSLCAIYIDGKEIRGEMLVVAFGIDTSGVMHVLGIRQGATENSAVCVGLIEDMVRRGLDSGGNYLFVLDGAKALRSAVTRVFGGDVHIQRWTVAALLRAESKFRRIRGYSQIPLLLAALAAKKNVDRKELAA